MINELILAEKVCYVEGLCNECISLIKKLKGCVDDLNLAGPLCLITCYADLLTCNELCCILFSASKLIDEVCAVLILSINGNLVVPPGLSCLNVCLDNYLSLKLCCSILRIGHNLCLVACVLSLSCVSLSCGCICCLVVNRVLNITCASNKSKYHRKDEHQCNNLFHSFVSLLNFKAFQLKYIIHIFFEKSIFERYFFNVCPFFLQERPL